MRIAAGFIENPIIDDYEGKMLRCGIEPALGFIFLRLCRVKERS